jgi:hypothetical protein
MSRTIRVLAVPDPSRVATKGLLDSVPTAVLTDVDFDALKAGFEKLSRDIVDLFPALPDVKGYGLKQIEVGVEISTEGGVSLIGTLKVGGTAAITLTFERR